MFDTKSKLTMALDEAAANCRSAAHQCGLTHKRVQQLRRDLALAQEAHAAANLAFIDAAGHYMAARAAGTNAAHVAHGAKFNARGA